jgi:hypothetical protein
MKRNLSSLALSLLLVSNNTIAQFAARDAMYLSRLNPVLISDSGYVFFPVANSSLAAQVLANYTGGGTYSQIQKNFSNNPFIRLPQLSGSSAAPTILGTQGISAIGGLNVTTVADGLAKFLVERTKQELSITFFSRFKTFLDSDEAKEFRVLFPNTKKALDVIDREVYQYANYLNMLREAFDRDLNSLLSNLPKVVDEKVQSPEVEYLILSLDLVSALKAGEHPATVLERLSRLNRVSPNHTIPDELRSFQEALKVFTIFSSSLRSNGHDRYWVTSDSISLLFEESTFKIYLGLIYAKHGEETIGGKKVKEYLVELKNAFDQKKENIKDLIVEIAFKANAVDQIIREDQQKKNRGEKVESYLDLFVSTTQLIAASSKVCELELFGLKGSSSSSKNFINMLSQAGYLATNVNERKFNAAILDLSTLLVELYGKTPEWNDELIRYGTFIANVAQAENSDQVKAAIEAVALPVGSASIKRKTISNIALNAYLGLAGGYEYNAPTETWKGTFGINSPVGIAFSRGHYKNTSTCYKERGSSTLFLSLVDIGAFSMFRFNDSETQELPEVTLANIFAPGLYYVYGFPKTPVSLGFGGQLGPQLRELTTTEATNSGFNGSLRVFLAIDIPLLNFYTKSR